MITQVRYSSVTNDYVFVLLYNKIFIYQQGGVYVFNMYDNYAAAGWCLFFIGICECITISWLYGINKYWNRVMHMFGFRLRVPWFKYAWAFVAPIVTAVSTSQSLWIFIDSFLV